MAERSVAVSASVAGDRRHRGHNALAVAAVAVLLPALACATSGGSASGGGGAGAAAGGGGWGGSGGAGQTGSGGAPGSGGAISSGGAGGAASTGGAGGTPVPGSGGALGSGGVVTGSGGSAAGSGGRGSGGAAGAGGGAGAGGNYTPPAAVRSEVLLGDGWRFLRSDATGASATTFNDASWTAVTVPHTWNNLDGQDGGNNYYKGIGWYRRHHMLPATAAGKRVYLELDGANIVADVWVNGVSLGQHRGGFARFRFDATAAMMPGADNVIAVRVSNAAVTDVAPLDADFTFFGGLYREVRVVVTEPVHVDMLDYASPGVYLETRNVSAASAELRARVRVKNDSTSSQSVTAETVVVRADGTVAARLPATATVAAGAAMELAATATITSPHLWNGIADPYLYTAHVELRAGGSLVDLLAQPLGFRSFAVDAATGFSLNGRALDLHGVNRHQDRLGMGWAIGAREQDEDMALIKEMGANTIRLSHYQQADYFHQLCDRNGMVVWAEIPLVNRITNNAAFTSNAVQQLTELVRQSFNHPSIVFWGIGNEQRTDDTATNDLLTRLDQLVRTEDPGRLSTYAQCCTSDTGGLPAHTQVVGYNTYYGWYDAFGTSEQFAAWADGLHAARPTWRLGLSEYGAGGAISQHTETPVRPDPYGTPHPEEWQNLVHEAHWKALKTRPYLWGKYIWNMFDFAVDSRDEGETTGRNDKGLVTYDRRTRKDAFFWYKANWTDEPLVYISSRRFTPRTAATTTVKVYSNTDSVELTVNGTSLGARTTAADRMFVWTGVALRAGENVVEAAGTRGTTRVTDRVTWTRM